MVNQTSKHFLILFYYSLAPQKRRMSRCINIKKAVMNFYYSRSFWFDFRTLDLNFMYS